MFYESELQFLCNTFRKSHVQTAVVPTTAPAGSILDMNLMSLFGYLPDQNMPLYTFFEKAEPHTVYKSTNAFALAYLYFLLPGRASLLFIGPFINAPLSPRQVLELGEKNGVPPKKQPLLESYYADCPVIPDSSPLYVMLDTFCEQIFGHAYATVDVEQERLSPASPIHTVTGGDSSDDILADMKAMEKRYSYENELMQAVTNGQIHKANQLFSSFSEQSFEKRVSDPLRNMKNYSIIMNTLLRKAAEQGGVHPIYLDRVSSSFAMRIEQLTSLAECGELMQEMFRSYCRLVRKHSMQDYSPIVQKAIIRIDSDLSANLTLHSLAADQEVSPGYLSTIFKKETGQTVTEYIRDKRLKHATHLLSTTHLQIQTVALHCGIMDVQYFSKLFKKQTGKTPKEYRESIK